MDFPKKKLSKKSSRWFLKNQTTKEVIRLNIGDTKILRDKYKYSSTHCIIEIFEDEIIKIHEIIPHRTYLNGIRITKTNLTAGDEIFLGDKRFIPRHIWQERAFQLIEKLPTKKLNPNIHAISNVNIILMDGDDDDDTSHSDIDGQNNLMKTNENGTSVFYTPESSPLQSTIVNRATEMQNTQREQIDWTVEERTNTSNKMVKSMKWCLTRINYDGQEKKVFYLNEGDTTIGRNKTADVTSYSHICSRNHCKINLDSAHDKITITNLSQNGTFVNQDRVQPDEICELQHNDIIGLGCNYTVFENFERDKWNDFSVYKLIDKTIEANQNADVVIDLVSDEEPEDVKPNIEIGMSVDDDMNVPDNDVTSPIIIDEDNEIAYSQHILMEIKKEVNCSQENGFVQDFSITIDDSDDSCDVGSYDNWKYRLSQDQDKKELAIKKVNESVQSKKRKITLPIEPMPMAKKRRNSMSASVQQKSTVKLSDKMSKACDDSTVPSTSKTENDAKNGQYIDHFDPFYAKVSKPVKNKSFEEALAMSNVMTAKKRIAHVPKKYPPANSNQILSILRLENGSWPSESRRRKIVRKVRFDIQQLHIREYTPEREDEIENVGVPSSQKADTIRHQQQIAFENDPLHTIISDITEWKTDWILQKNITPPINGVDLAILPMIDKYVSSDAYRRTVIPLLKHELWSSIVAENQNRNCFEVKVNTVLIAKRHEKKRKVFHVVVVSETASAKANVGDFVKVESNVGSSFFAYVTESRFQRSGYLKTIYFTMEASENVTQSDYAATNLFITVIANIRTELKLFNAVFHLDMTPLKNLILNPVTYKEPHFPDKISTFHYSGYDKLNAEQMDILKSVYNKCLSQDTSISLVEGPPGTGKTRLIVSIILQLLFGQEMKKKLRILVLSASNNAVDIIARRLIYIREKMIGNDKQKFLNVVRFGVLNSMHPDVRKIAPQNLINNRSLSPTKQCEITRNLLEEKESYLAEIERIRKEPDAQSSIKQDMIKHRQKMLNSINESLARQHNHETSITESENITNVMVNARVVCSTLSSSINLKQYIKKFDVCFIDEASQCTEPWSLVPLQYNISQLILVGDSNQLSPVVLSTVCRSNNMDRSLFTRLFDNISHKGSMEKSAYAMTTQYRMHPSICHFPNLYFYKNRLHSAPLTSEHFELRPYSVFNLSCLQSNRDNVHFYNTDEAKFIVMMLKVMTKHANPKDNSYGIITPYSKQKAEIQYLLGQSQALANLNIPVNTIDSYQGQEKDVIILCTTRTTGIGFLANPHRLNVALTRAKKCLVICGNFTSISNSLVWKELLNDAEKRKKLHDIPPDYDFKMIADLLVIPKKPKINATSNMN